MQQAYDPFYVPDQLTQQIDQEYKIRQMNKHKLMNEQREFYQEYIKKKDNHHKNEVPAFKIGHENFRPKKPRQSIEDINSKLCTNLTKDNIYTQQRQIDQLSYNKRYEKDNRNYNIINMTPAEKTNNPYQSKIVDDYDIGKYPEFQRENEQMISEKKKNDDLKKNTSKHQEAEETRPFPLKNIDDNNGLTDEERNKYMAYFEFLKEEEMKKKEMLFNDKDDNEENIERKYAEMQKEKRQVYGEVAKSQQIPQVKELSAEEMQIERKKKMEKERQMQIIRQKQLELQMQQLRLEKEQLMKNPKTQLIQQQYKIQPPENQQKQQEQKPLSMRQSTPQQIPQQLCLQTPQEQIPKTMLEQIPERNQCHIQTQSQSNNEIANYHQTNQLPPNPYIENLQKITNYYQNQPPLTNLYYPKPPYGTDAKESPSLEKLKKPNNDQQQNTFDLQEEARREFLTNKMKNVNGYANLTNMTSLNPSLKLKTPMRHEEPSSEKIKQMQLQQQYKQSLDDQVLLNKQQRYNPTDMIHNPYSTQNYQISTSALQNNPISRPYSAMVSPKQSSP